MPANPVRIAVTVPQALWLGAFTAVLFLLQTSRALSIGGVNPNLVLVFMIALATFMPRFWVAALLGGVIMSAALIWTPFDAGSAALATGIGLAAAAVAPFLTGRSFSDAFILLAGAEVAWNAGTWHAGVTILTALKSAGVGFVEHAALLVIFWFLVSRLAYRLSVR